MQELGIKNLDSVKRKDDSTSIAMERNSLIRADVIISTRLYLFGPDSELWSFDSYISEQTTLLSMELRIHLIHFGSIRLENNKEKVDLSNPFWQYISLNDAFFWQLALDSLDDLLKGWFYGLCSKPNIEEVEIWTSVIRFCQKRDCRKKRAELKQMGYVMKLIYKFLIRSTQMQALIKLLEVQQQVEILEFQQGEYDI